MNIDIPETLFSRLQRSATPLVDTPISVIERWADFYEQHHPESQAMPNGVALTASAGSSEDLEELDPIHPPSLLHTTVRGEFGGVHFSNWNDLLRLAHIEAYKKAKSFDELRRVTLAQVSPGNRDDSGYHFLPEINMSLQGVDANRGWQYAKRLARYVRVELRAVIEWRNTDKAAYPGKRARLHIPIP